MNKLKFTLTAIRAVVAYLVLWAIESAEGKIFRLVEILLMFMLIYTVLFFACSI